MHMSFKVNRRKIVKLSYYKFLSLRNITRNLLPCLTS